VGNLQLTLQFIICCAHNTPLGCFAGSFKYVYSSPCVLLPNIEDAIKKAEEVYKTCEFLAVVMEKATCKSFGIE